MRIAVIHPDGAVSAYRLGRVEDGVHNVDAIGNRTGSIEDVLGQLETMAREEYPDCQVERQKLVMSQDGTDTSEWVHVDSFDPEVHAPTRPGESIVPEEFRVAVNVETS